MNYIEEKLIEDLFYENCNPKYLGYLYAQDVMKRIMSCKFYKLRCVCREVGREYETSMESVERCIRTFIAVSWEQFGIFKQRPESKEFFAKCVTHIKRIGFDKTCQDMTKKTVEIDFAPVLQ